MKLDMETLSANAIVTKTTIVEWCKKQLDKSYELRRLRYAHIFYRQESEVYPQIHLMQTPEDARQIRIAIQYLDLNHRAISRLPDAARQRQISVAAS